MSWPAEGDRPACALRTFPNVSDKTDGKWAVVWEPGTDVLWWVDDSEVGKMTLVKGKAARFKYSVDTSCSPATIDWKPEGTNFTLLGLVEISNGTLKLSMANNEAPVSGRPNQLAPEKGSGYYEFRRDADVAKSPLKFFVAFDREFETSIRERTEIERRDVFLGGLGTPLFTAADCTKAEIVATPEGLSGLTIQFTSKTAIRLKEYFASVPNAHLAVSSVDRETGIYCIITLASWRGDVAVFQGAPNVNVGKRIVGALQREFDKSVREQTNAEPTVVRVSPSRPMSENPVLNNLPHPEKIFKKPGPGADVPAFNPASEEEQKQLDGLWDVVEVSFMGQVWLTYGARQVLIENGKWLGYDPHEPFENETANFTRDFKIGLDNTFERVEIERNRRISELGRYKLDGDRLWLAVKKYEIPVRAIPTVVEPQVQYYLLHRRIAEDKQNNSNPNRPAVGLNNTAHPIPQSIEEITRSYNDSTARLRLELFQSAIPDLTVEQMKGGLKLAAETQRCEGRLKTAKVLQDFAETGTLPQMGGYLFSYGTHELDTNGVTLSRLIVPTFAIATEDKSQPEGETGVPVVLTSLSLVYEKGGYVSKTYEDSANAQMRVLKEK